MKKNLLLTLSIISMAGLLVGCGNGSKDADSTPAASTPAAGQTSSTVAEATETYKHGLGTRIAVTGWQDETVGIPNQITVSVASVVFSNDDKVVSAYIDEIQIPLVYTAAVTDPVAAEAKLELDTTKAQYTYRGESGQAIASKKELLNHYGMEQGNGYGQSTIGEWYEQAAAFETWCVGKTITEITAPSNYDPETGKPTEGSGLTSDCTMTVNTHASDIAAAYARADKTIESAVAPVAGAGIYFASIGSSYSAKWQIDVEMAGTAVNASKTADAVSVDVYQIPFLETGVLNSNSTQMKDATEVNARGPIASKEELQDKYGMKQGNGGSSTVGEWYEQAAAYEIWAAGKDATALKAGVTAAGDDKNKPSDPTLSADCTITIDGFVSSTTEALVNIKA